MSGHRAGGGQGIGAGERPSGRDGSTQAGGARGFATYDRRGVSRPTVPPGAPRRSSGDAHRAIDPSFPAELSTAELIAPRDLVALGLGTEGHGDVRALDRLAVQLARAAVAPIAVAALVLVALELVESVQSPSLSTLRVVVATGAGAFVAIVLAIRGRLLRRDAERRSERLVAELYRIVATLRAAERARSEAELSRHTAEAANRAKSDFLAVMSHELRTPLNAIAGYAQLMEMEIHGPLAPEQREDLRRIRRAQAHLLGLINDVLNLARIETGRLEYHLEEIDLAACVADVAVMIEAQFDAKEIRFAAAVPEGLHVVADADKLRQILINLLGNACKFTPSGGWVRVALASRGGTGERDGEDDRLFLQVRDGGVGVPRDKQEAVFQPFVRVDSSLTRSTEGAGLGLAISRDFARGMGGDLRVRGSAEGGSVFTLTLRRAPAVS